MAKFHVTGDSSVYSTSLAAFHSDSTAADSLLVDDGAFLIAAAALTNAVELAATGAWTLTVNGSIFSAAFAGIAFAAASTPSKITVSDSGQIGGSTDGINGAVGFTIKNAGTISGGSIGIYAGGTGDHTLTNTGTVKGGTNAFFDIATGGSDTITNTNDMTGDVTLSNAKGTVTNSGTLTGALTFGTGADKLTNSGTITDNVNFNIGGATFSNSGRILQDVQFGAGDDTATNSGVIFGDIAFNSGKVNLTNSGIIHGDVHLTVGDATFKNTGTVDGQFFINSGITHITNAGTLFHIDGSFSADFITNSKTITTSITLFGGDNVLTNKGSIGTSVSGGSDDDTLTNSGTIGTTVNLSNGNNKLTNSGTIFGDVQTGDGNDTVINSKSMAGALNLGNGVNHLTNSGTISLGVMFGAGDDVFTNSGTISGAVDLGAGLDTVTNTGTITGTVTDSDGDLTLKNSKEMGVINITSTDTHTMTNSGHMAELDAIGSNTFTNSGTIDFNVELSGSAPNTFVNSGHVNGIYLGGSDTDRVTNTGVILGFSDLRDGDDFFTGGAHADLIRDGNGSDTIKLMTGDDTYIATGSTGTDGHDTIDGGAGVDTYDASSSTHSVAINLDTVSHDLSPILPGADVMAANTGQGLDVAGGGTDTISNFENASGGAQADTLYGNASANTLKGNGGDDFLFSFAGNDILSGGTGNDLIFGGAGRDVLSGGAGNDIFLFANATETGKTAATRDEVTDFNTNSAGNDADVLNFSLMDADPTTTGDQAFVFDGTNVNFTGTHGELRAYATVTGYIVDGDLNGDKIPDFSVAIDDPTHATVWHASISAGAGIDILL